MREDYSKIQVRQIDRTSSRVRKIAYDEQESGSTIDLRKISRGEDHQSLFVISRALFWDLYLQLSFVLFVLFDLFGIDDGFLVLMGGNG